MQINTNYDNLEQSYLFSTIARKVREYSASHPEADIIRLGICANGRLRCSDCLHPGG